MVSSNVAFDLFPPKAGPGSKPAWSEMELDMLRRFYSSIPAAALAKKLKRTARSVTCRAFRLGLKKSHERLREMGASNVEARWK
jgi:hypothetical protein